MEKSLHALEDLEGSFSKALLISFGLHLAVVLIFLIVEHLHPGYLKISTDVYHVSLVSLPPKTSNSAAPSKPTISDQLPRATIEQMRENPVAPPKTKDMTLPSKEKVKPEKKEEALDRKKLSNEISKIKHEIALERRIEAIAKRAKETRTGEVNGVENSAGSVGGKELGAAEGYQLAQYQDQIRSQVLKAWNLPKWTIDSIPKDSYLILIVYIAKDGAVLRTEFEKSSNIPVLDESAVRAVKRASPLLAPPQDLAEEAEKRGLAMRFSPQKTEP